MTYRVVACRENEVQCFENETFDDPKDVVAFVHEVERNADDGIIIFTLSSKEEGHMFASSVMWVTSEIKNGDAIEDKDIEQVARFLSGKTDAC